MKKSFLIPLVLVVLGILVPVVYATTRGDETPEPPSSASVEPAIIEEEKAQKAQGEEQENQQNDLEKEEETAEEEDKDQPVSNVATSPDKGKQSDKSSQSAKSSTSSKQESKQSQPAPSQSSDQKANYMQVTVTIVGKNGNIMYNSAKVDVKEKGTVLDALYATGVSCKVRSDGYVRAISGLAENLSNGEGWMYAVNGGSPPGVGANSYTVNNGDCIIWFYGKIGDPPPKV